MSSLHRPGMAQCRSAAEPAYTSVSLPIPLLPDSVDQGGETTWEVPAQPAHPFAVSDHSVAESLTPLPPSLPWRRRCVTVRSSLHLFLTSKQALGFAFVFVA